jgi:prevent-host-death family protein
MTRNRQTTARAAALPGHWALQDAKARFSEVVRKAKTEGPQKITVHGREEVVVVSVEEYQRAKGEPTGEVLVKVMQDPRVRGLRIERVSFRARVRDVKL